jgi:hypothetical protein
MKTLKVVLVIIFLSGVFQNAFSQQIKTYEGTYEKGNAVYQYFENENYERILQGNFKYTSKYVTVTGQYDKNIKVGQWTITKGTNLLYENIKEIVTGKYINGKMNGLWTLKRTDLKTNKILINSLAHFKDDYLIDGFKYYNSKFDLNNAGQKSELSLTGKFNDKGSFDSTWVISYKINEIPFEDIKKFKDGLLYFNLVRNLSTGEISEKYDNSVTPMRFYTMKHGYVYTNKYVHSLGYNSGNLYSRVLEVWTKIRTFKTYESEDLNTYHSFSVNLDLSSILTGSAYDSSDFIDDRTIPNQLRFNSIILKADSAFKIKKYMDATDFYNDALRIKYSSYADSMIKEIKKIR